MTEQESDNRISAAYEQIVAQKVCPVCQSEQTILDNQGGVECVVCGFKQQDCKHEKRFLDTETQTQYCTYCYSIIKE